jgi:hypothetical protein
VLASGHRLGHLPTAPLHLVQPRQIGRHLVDRCS